MKKNNNLNKQMIKKMCLISIFSAISLILYIVGPKFSLPFFPAFLEINLSMLPILIATFMGGLSDGLIVSIIRFLIKLPFSSTGFVGELSDLVIAVIVVLALGLVNKKEKLPCKNLIMLAVGIISWIIAGYISNSFSLPFYLNLFGKEAVLGACSMIPGINENNLILMYYLFGITPFNFCVSFVVVGVTLLVNKRLKSIYDKI